MKVELSNSLKSLWKELDIEQKDYDDTNKKVSDIFKKNKKFDDLYIERIAPKKLQLIFTNTEDLFGTNYTIDLHTNTVTKKRFGFLVNEGVWKGDIFEILKKISIMESEVE